MLVSARGAGRASSLAIQPFTCEQALIVSARAVLACSRQSTTHVLPLHSHAVNDKTALGGRPVLVDAIFLATLALQEQPTSLNAH